jgi:hypothetical protein
MTYDDVVNRSVNKAAACPDDGVSSSLWTLPVVYPKRATIILIVCQSKIHSSKHTFAYGKKAAAGALARSRVCVLPTSLHLCCACKDADIISGL